MTTTPQPFSLSLSPASVRLPHLTSYHGHVTVTDSGTAPLHVSMSGESLTHCSPAVAGARPSWLHVSSTAFTLAPGQSRTVSYTVAAPAGTTGSAAILATGSPAVRQHGNATLSGAVGSRVTLGSAVCHNPAAAPASHPGSSPAGLIALVLVLVAAALVTAVVVRRRLHRKVS